MPTVPVRNTLMTGRRNFPFRGWHDWRGLLDSPGWAPMTGVSASLPAALRRAGYWTAYVTDNPFLGFSSPTGRCAAASTASCAPAARSAAAAAACPSTSCATGCSPRSAATPKVRSRMRKYLANSHYSHDETRSFAARVFTDAVRVLDRAATQRPFAMVVDTYEPHEPWTPPRKYIDMYGDPDYRGPEPGSPATDGSRTTSTATIPRACSAGCARSTRPRSR